MKKEFVPYKLAVKLKALGFDEICFCWYSKEHEKCFILTPEYSNVIVKRDCISVPTFSQAFRWFREKYGMYSHIKTSGKISVLEFTWVSNGKYGFFSKDGFKTYEEAELACLDKLIEIVESKSE